MAKSLIQIEAEKLNQQLAGWRERRVRAEGLPPDSVDECHYLYKRLVGARARIKQLNQARYREKRQVPKKA